MSRKRNSECLREKDSICKHRKTSMDTNLNHRILKALFEKEGAEQEFKQIWIGYFCPTVDHIMRQLEDEYRNLARELLLLL